MSVEKKTPTEFKNASIGFTVLQTDVINMLNGDSLAIWAYICAKPSNWIVRKEHIFKQLNIKEIRYRRAIDKLKNLGLIKIEAIKNKSGKLKSTTYIARNCLHAFDNAEIPENTDLGENADVGEKPRLEKNRDSRKQHPYKDKDILQKKDLLQTPNNNKGVNENEQTNLEFNEPEKQNLNPNPGTHEEQVEFGFDKPEPKRRFNIETFADNVAEVWDEIAIQSNIKSPGGRKSAASSTSRNNITKIIKLAKKSESKLDYKSLDAWRKYFTTLIAHTNDNPVVAPGRSFKWAVKEKTYEQLTNDDYLRWSSNKRMA